MNSKLLQSIALMFTALVLLQAFLGAFLFVRLVGITPEAVYHYYGDKSLHGLLEVALPHVLFISAALIAVLHFLAFIHSISEKRKKSAIHIVFTLFLVDQLSPILIAQGFEIFSSVKIAAFLGFEIALVWVWIMIFRESLQVSFGHR